MLKTRNSNSLPFPSRPCPVCKSEWRHLLFAQRFSTLSEGSLLTGYNLVACEECGLCFADHIPNQSAFDLHYTEMSKYEYAHYSGAESDFDAARFVTIAKYLAKEVPDRATRILDIGCATGGQLARLQNLGYKNVIGLDPSPGCSRLARNHYNIEVLAGTIFKNELPEHAFDLILLVGVLEHIHDVAEAVANLSQWLSPEGLVLAEVPDATALADWPDAPYQEFSIEHINFFGPKSLQNLMGVAGYKLVKMDRPPRQFTKTTVMPSAAGLFRFTGSPLPIEKDEESEPRMLEYIAQSAAEEDRVSLLIDKLVHSQEKIVVWGVGTHTLHLAETTGLGNANISAFIDANAKFHGKELFNRPVLPPESMEGRDEPILISSRAFQHDICTMISERLNLPNRQILLYADPSS